MNPYAAAALMVVVAFLVGWIVWVLLEPVRIDRTGDRFDYGLTDDDAPRDDNDWPREVQRNDCSWCGAPNTHYLTHVCPGCQCWFTEVEIPGEPQLGSYLEGEMNPDCPIHSRRINGDH